MNIKSKFSLSQKGIIDVLSENGFRKEYNGIGSCVFKRITSNSIEDTCPIKIKNFIINHLSKEKSKKALAEFYRRADVLIDYRKLELLPDLDITLFKNSKSTATFAFKNIYVTVTPNKILTKSYTELGDKIRFNRITDLEFTRTNEKSQFESFLALVTDRCQARLNSIMTAIGYLCHNFHDPSLTKAVIFIDEEISDINEANGGTGKSLVARGIQIFLGGSPYVVNEDGRNFNPQKNFAFQQLNKNSVLLIFNDAASNFPFKRLVSVLTDGITVEKKYRDAYRLSSDELPKVLITTNFMLEGDLGFTDERRRFEVEFSNYFGKHKTPKDEFGQLLFDDWDTVEWNLFNNFMLKCVQLYLAKGLIEAPQVNTFRKKIISQAGSEVVTFFDWYLQKIFPEGEIKRLRIVKGEMYSLFIKRFPSSTVNNAKLPKLFKIYLTGIGIAFTEINQGGVRMFELIP